MVVPIASSVPSLIELQPGVSPPTALPDRLYATLKYRILTCAMLPGERIVEKKLCEEMQVSRTPLREAFNRLALEGLIVLSPYRGISVSPVTVKDYEELCELRRIVEGGMAALAATRASDEDLQRITEAAEAHYQLGKKETYPDFLRANSAFHLALVRSTHNHRLEGLVMSALDRLQRPLYLGLGFGIDSEASSNEHLEIVAAIRKRWAEHAKRLMVTHIGQAETRIVAALRAAGY